MGARWRYRLATAARALMLALAGFMLMGSLAVIGAHSDRGNDADDRVNSDSPLAASPSSGR
jgi:hypothetical protein